MKSLTASILLGLSLSGVGYAQKQCYYPNGQKAANDFPCGPDDADSACCGGGQGSVCLTNKLCRSPDGHTIRGSCTDKNWASADCPQYCLSAFGISTLVEVCRDANNIKLPGANTGGTDLISCSNVTKSDTSFCCDHARPFCCDEGVARFDVFPSNPQVSARWDTQSTRFVKVLQQTSSSSSSSQASTTSTSAASSTSTTPVTTTSLSTSQTSNPPSAASDASTQSSQSLSTAAQAGIGVGAAVLAIALAAVAFLLFKLRKKKALLAEMETQQQQQHQPLHQHQQHQGAGSAFEYKYDNGAGYYGHPRHELGDGQPRPEMDGQAATFELPVTAPGPGRGY